MLKLDDASETVFIADFETLNFETLIFKSMIDGYNYFQKLYPSIVSINHPTINQLLSKIVSISH